MIINNVERFLLPFSVFLYYHKQFRVKTFKLKTTEIYTYVTQKNKVLLVLSI